MKKVTLLLALFVASLSFGQVVINEVDADVENPEVLEFVELFTSTPNFSLDGYIVVFFNGNGDLSYNTIDLNGFSTDADGYLIIGGDGISGAEIGLGTNANGLIQNGADAVAIYQDDASNFPNDTPVTMTNIIDALVYGTNDDDDMELLNGLGETIQYDEDANGMKDTESIQRATDGTYCVGSPTLRAANIDCGTVCPLQVSVESVLCDAVTGGTDTYTTSLSFTGGGTEDYTITVTDGTVSGDDPDSDASGLIIITGVDEGVDFTYTISSATCDISNTINAPDCVPASDVNSIAELRDGTIGLTYTLTSEAILTFQRSERNQKWIEDATGAILIDDAAGEIFTIYNEGDGITGISGELGEFGGVLQFVPDADTGDATSTGNTVEPQTITIAQFTANPEEYESELIAFTDVTYTDADGSTMFEEDTDYEIADASGTVIHRTNFDSEDTDYIGQVIPENTIATYVALGSAFNDMPQVLVRRAEDIMLTLGTEENTLEGLSIFPNPTSTGYVNITSQVAGDMNVVVYDVLGKQVINTVVSNEQLNIGSLKSGVYIMNITQGNAATTKKLVVK